MKLQKLLNGRSPEQASKSTGKLTSPIPESSMIPKRTELEADKATESSKILQPTQFDVLFGRGKPYQGHAGNIRLHKVVDLYKTRYSKARRHEKTEIAEEIVQFVKNGGAKAGRFLKRLEGEESWVEVSDSIARDKVSHALRGKPRKEESSASSVPVVEELVSGSKRLSVLEGTPENTKRPKLDVPTAVDLLSAERARIAALTSFGASSAVGLPLALRQHLLSQSRGLNGFCGPLGGMPLGGLSGLLRTAGPLSNPLFGSQALHDPFLQRLRVEQSLLGADPRFWW